jgi:hypothetical protein
MAATEAPAPQAPAPQVPAPEPQVGVVGAVAYAAPVAATAVVEEASPAPSAGVAGDIVISCGGAGDTWQVVASASECPGDRALRVEQTAAVG